MIVVDASVAAKWLLPEVGSEAALELIAGTDMLIAPSLIRFEVLGAITRNHRLGFASADLSRDRCGKWLGYLDEGAISLVPEDALVSDAVELAILARHSLADCLYLNAARSFGGTLVTADRVFAERAKPIHAQIELLKDCEAN